MGAIVNVVTAVGWNSKDEWINWELTVEQDLQDDNQLKQSKLALGFWVSEKVVYLSYQQNLKHVLFVGAEIFVGARKGNHQTVGENYPAEIEEDGYIDYLYLIYSKS